MKYNRQTVKYNKTPFPLKIVKKKVPFNKKGEQEMYCLRAACNRVKTFEELAREFIRYKGFNEHQAEAMVGVLNEGICQWIESGYAVSIGDAGTLKPVVNSKAHLDPHDCSVDDIRSIKLQFYPGKKVNDTLESVALRVTNRKPFIAAWEAKQKKKSTR